MALILERKHAYSYTNADIARILGVSRQTASRMMKQHSDSWELGTIKKLCKNLGVTAEEVRAAIQF